MSTAAKPAHTPGPWRFKTAANGDCGISAGGTGVFAEVFADIRHAGEDARDEATNNARLIAAAPELDAAAGPAITALSFAQERAFNERDTVAYDQITAAKDALIAAQDKARGRDSKMVDVTPPRAAIAKATGAA